MNHHIVGSKDTLAKRGRLKKQVKDHLQELKDEGYLPVTSMQEVKDYIKEGYVYLLNGKLYVHEDYLKRLK